MGDEIEWDNKVFYESINKYHHQDTSTYCPCCGGDEHRGRYKHTKTASRKHNIKARRAKPKSKDHRWKEAWS